jgi:uncharacterized membrane protein YeiH
VSDALFTIPLWADLLAVGVGSAQGAVFAAQFRDRRLDWLGVAIIGLATGLGGGFLRDIMLARVPAALESNWYLPVAIGAALLGMLAQKVLHRIGGLITVLDALTLGLFGAIGTTKALANGIEPVPAIFVGAIAAVGGSVLRDLLLTLPPAIMQVGSLYAVAAIAGAGTIVGAIAIGLPVILAAAIGVAVTFGLRVLAVLFHWSLPEQRSIERLSISRLRRRIR